ncbi:MAG: hypothetical protein JSS59_10180 [Proteobacteria bacterium]|uniref:hypothetical protein n=1 Tax=Rudaea sp. TaxID=2136325 RepID=UPI00378521C4|nr:hypothetical protein [Pseudomonadota bacterium]
MTEMGDPEIRDWLLCRLDVRHSAELERQLFVDVDLANRIDAIECDLIDDCACGRLPTADARLVRARDAWRVRFARALIDAQRIAPMPVPAPKTCAPGLRRAGFAAAIAASLLLAVVGVRWWTLVPAPAEQAANTASLPVVTLLAGQQRGVSDPIALPAHAGDVRVQAQIGDGAATSSSRYVLSVANGERILFAARGLRLRAAGPYRFVEAVVPAADLGPDTRRVVVAEQGAEDFPVSSWDVQMPMSR